MKNEDASLTGLWRWNDVLFKHVSTTTSDTSTKEALKKKKKKEDFITSVPELSGTRISF